MKKLPRVGLDGIVCAAADMDGLQQGLPSGFHYVTPGIQGPRTAAGSDQKRIATPYDAIRNGASTLVVGRAITCGKTPADRQAAAYSILEDMARARRGLIK